MSGTQNHDVWYTDDQVMMSGTQNYGIWYRGQWCLVHITMASGTDNNDVWYTELWHLVHRTMSSTQNYGIWYREQWCLTELEVGVVGADVVAGTHDPLHDERHSNGIQQAKVLGYPILPLQTSILLQQLAVQQVSEDVHAASSAISPSFTSFNK